MMPADSAAAGEPLTYRQMQRGALTAWALEEGTGAVMENWVLTGTLRR